jgi:hypothetical protein
LSIRKFLDGQSYTDLDNNFVYVLLGVVAAPIVLSFAVHLVVWLFL